MAATELDVSALYEALDRQRRARDMAWRQLAKELELSPSTFTRMAQGNRPDADALLTMVRWLGVPAERFAGGEAAPTEAEPLTAITSYLRASRSLSRDQAKALSNIIEAAYKSIVREK